MLIKYIYLILSFIILAGCSKQNDNNDDDQNVVLRVVDIFPFNENVFYQYQGQGNELAAWDIFIDHINNNVIQRRITAGDREVVEVLEQVAGKLILRHSEQNFFRHEDLTDQDATILAIILQEPIQLGATWNVDANEIAEVTNMNADIETSYGRFTSAIEITHTSTTSTVVNYYVKGLGHVKAVTKLENGLEIITELSRIEEDARLDRTIEIYIQDENSEIIDSEIRSISIATNDNIIELLNKELRIPLQQSNIALLSGDAKINNIIFDSGIITVDLSSEYVTQANWSNEAEEIKMLSSLLNALMRFYYAGAVMVTIDGNAYEGQHITMELGQLLEIVVTSYE